MRQEFSDTSKSTEYKTPGRLEDEFDDVLEHISQEDEEAAARSEALRAAISTRRNALRFGRFPTAGAFVSVGIMLALLRNQPNTHTWANLTLFSVSYALMIGSLFKGSKQLSKALKNVSADNNSKTIGLLIEALDLKEPTVSLAGSLLILHIPKMTEKQFRSLTESQRSSLRRAVRIRSSRFFPTRYNPVFCTAVLQLLGRVGDSADLQVLSQLERMSGKSEEQAKLRQLAVVCRGQIVGRQLGAAELNSLKNETETIVALNPVQTKDPETTLAEKLGRLAKLRRRNILVTAGAAVTGTILAMLSIAYQTPEAGTSPILGISSLITMAIMIAFAVSGTYSQRNLMDALMNSNDLNIVPHLIQAAATVEVSASTAVIVLTRLLPNVRASDGELFDSDTRALFNVAIAKHANNSSFVSAALGALQQIGDSRSIPTVRKIAEAKRHESSVRQAARECLGYLHQRALLSEANQTLLRASSASEISSDALVRPVTGEVEGESADLLRTSSAPIVYMEESLDEGNEFGPAEFAAA